jgi:hypothetical protein
VGCYLPAPRMGQWEFSAQALFARTKGTIAWPRYSIYLSWYANREMDLNNDLGLNEHDVLVDFTARYQFRPNWAIQYSVLGKEFNGGTQYGNNYNYGYFGNLLLSYGQQIQSKWTHGYQRAQLVYDAVKTCNTSVSVLGGWVHADDRIDVLCVYCGPWINTFSKGTDAATVGLQYQRCIKTAANGGTFSFDHKASAIFLDNVEGYDLQAGARYSIPLNCGRAGYVKGGYRLVTLNKSQSDFLYKNSLEGGFMEFGFIF